MDQRAREQAKLIAKMNDAAQAEARAPIKRAKAQAIHPHAPGNTLDDVHSAQPIAAADSQAVAEHLHEERNKLLRAGHGNPLRADADAPAPGTGTGKVWKNPKVLENVKPTKKPKRRGPSNAPPAAAEAPTPEMQAAAYSEAVKNQKIFNYDIKAASVRLLSPTKQQLGVMTVSEVSEWDQHFV